MLSMCFKPLSAPSLREFSSMHKCKENDKSYHLNLTLSSILWLLFICILSSLHKYFECIKHTLITPPNTHTPPFINSYLPTGFSPDSLHANPIASLFILLDRLIPIFKLLATLQSHFLCLKHTLGWWSVSSLSFMSQMKCYNPATFPDYPNKQSSLFLAFHTELQFSGVQISLFFF